MQALAGVVGGPAPAEPTALCRRAFARRGRSDHPCCGSSRATLQIQKGPNARHVHVVEEETSTYAYRRLCRRHLRAIRRSATAKLLGKYGANGIRDNLVRRLVDHGIDEHVPLRGGGKGDSRAREEERRTARREGRWGGEKGISWGRNRTLDIMVTAASGGHSLFTIRNSDRRRYEENKQPLSSLSPSLPTSNSSQRFSRIMIGFSPPSPILSSRSSLPAPMAGPVFFYDGSLEEPLLLNANENTPSSSSSSPSSSTVVSSVATKAKQGERKMEDRPLLSFQGGGMFFYWQLGAGRALSRHFELRKADLAGASAGALAATLAACEVDAEEATKLAFQLSLDNGVWDRPTGLGGIWGRMIRSWLEELLPPNAAQLCDSRLHIYVLELPSLSRRSAAFVRRGVCDFHSKSDLINACMASVHIPFFIDGGPCARFRDRWCVDGSFLASREAICPDDPSRPTVWVDYTDDEVLAAQRLRFLSLGSEGEGPQRTWKWVMEMMERGETHIERLLSENKLDALEPIRKV